MPDSSEPRIRVLSVDDRESVRRAVAAALLAYGDLELVGQATNGIEAVQLCAQLQPDIVLMDLVMPAMSGATATRAIRQRWPQVHVIGLTAFGDFDLIDEALAAGADRCLIKDVSADDLAAAIRDVHHQATFSRLD